MRGLCIDELIPKPRFGALLRSDSFRSGWKIDVRVGELGGKASSAGFLGARARLGDTDGLDRS